MNFTKEEALKAPAFSAVKTESAAAKCLIIDICQNPFTNMSAYVDDLNKASKNRDLNYSILEFSKLSEYWLASIREIFRIIPQYDSIQIYCDDTFSFPKIVLPTVLLARFFGKSVALFYYPELAFGKIAWAHRKTMSLCHQVYVGSRYQQRELLRCNVNSEVMAPPIDLVAYPERKLTEVQPRLVIIHDGSKDSAVMCAMRAFDMVKQKYPRAEMCIITTIAGTLYLQEVVVKQRHFGYSFENSKNMASFKKAFAKADVFLNCNFQETAPLSLYAAMASGLPAISFESYGAREIIDNGVNGLLIRHNDHSQLANQIIKLIEEPALVSSISKEAAKIRKNLAPDQITLLPV